MSSGNPRSDSSKVKNVVSASDRAAVRKHYTFLPTERNDRNGDFEHGSCRERTSSNDGSWQHRMVEKYHDHLFKEFALADLSVPGKIGLRWRTREEVLNGRGDRNCGNNRCKFNRDDDHSLITLEVPFSYCELGERKKELVKVKLCRSCRPLLSCSTKTQSPNSTKPNTKRNNDENICAVRQDKRTKCRA